MKQVIVIGAGPAGMLAAIAAARQGAEVTLAEKNKRAGIKLSITGKGRCNITTALEPEEQLASYPRNGKFLYSALHQFSNRDFLELLLANGCPTKVERGARVFPVSDRAQDVVQTVLKLVKQAKVNIVYNYPVQWIKKRGNHFVTGAKGQRELIADALVIATGGLSYPGTGSTGDGYTWGEAFGHRVTPTRPGLIPLVAEETWIRDMQGLSLKNVQLTAYGEKQKINQEFGEMLFTHFGISGPIVLSLSRDIVEFIAEKKKPVKMVLDLKPALSEQKLEERLLRDFTKHSNKQLANALTDLLPGKMIPAVILQSGISADKQCHQITRAQRLKLLKSLKELTFTVKGWRPVEEAIVTTGGISVKEINPKTMESKLVPGLYWAGEVIDVDGYTGGFNLQQAWSTGWVAGYHAGLFS